MPHPIRYILLITCAFISVHVDARDTTLTRQFQLPYPVNSVALDSTGQILIGSARGRERWNGETFEVINAFDFDGVVNFQGNVLSHEEFVLRTGIIPNEHFREWRRLIPSGKALNLTAAQDTLGKVWVCDGKRLYNFEIGRKSNVLLPECSVRGLAFFDEHWMALTYNGIYLDGHRICPEVLMNDGNILVRTDSVLTFGHRWVVVHLKDTIACDDYNERISKANNNKFFTLQAGAEWQGRLIIGNNLGLGEWVTESFHYLHTGFDVRYLVPAENGLFVLTAEDGVHFWDGELLRFTGIEAACAGMVPWTNGRWAVATERGLGIWSPSMKTFDYLTTRDGLTSNSICAVHVDAQECIWFSSYSGILRYSEDHGIVEIHHPDVEFNRGSFATDEKGALYFGSTEGIFTIVPGPLKLSSDGLPRMIWILIAAITMAGCWIVWLIRLIRMRQRTLKAQRKLHQQEAFKLRVESLVLEGLPHSSVVMIAEKMGLSERQFYRTAAQLDIKPGPIIRATKLKRARNLIASGEHSMQEVASEVGYTVSYLRRVLKSTD